MPRQTVIDGRVYLETALEGEPSQEILDWLPGDPVPENTAVRKNPNLELTWNRDTEWVQLALIITPDFMERLVAANADGADLSIVTDVLSRKEINELIRTLRRARDSAYGSDE